MKDGFVKVAAATPEIIVADVKYNESKIRAMMSEAYEQGVRVLVFPELCLTGYTCGDLFLHQPLINGALLALKSLAEYSENLSGMLTFIGLPLSIGGALYNCAAAISGGKLLGLIPKTNIPNYGEFYEKRWFSPSPEKSETIYLSGFEDALPFGGRQIFDCLDLPELAVGCEICEDLWVPCPPSTKLTQLGATIIVNLSASNEIIGKDDFRRTLITSQSARLISGYVYADAGAGESSTDLVFTGHNLIAENGSILAERETLSGMVISEIDVKKLSFERRRIGFPQKSGEADHIFWSSSLSKTSLTRFFDKSPFVPADEAKCALRCEKILSIQSLGLKKRIEHSGSKRMVLGVSGGLDSTLAMLVCARTADLLGRGRESILAVTMPCFGTTTRTKSNATLLAERLGAELRVVDIGNAVKTHFADIGHDYNNKNVVFENAQARERTQVLMDMANACSGLVVGTGDLSELALGWATFNGDHMCMYGVNGGVPKTLVRHLVSHYADNCGDAELSAVLRDILDTPVSPELLPAENGEISQKTEDLVGPYVLHDFFLYYLIRCGYTPAKVYRISCIAFEGDFSGEIILHWLKTFCRRFFSQQFKRSCLPDGPKVGTLSLSPRGDWRMPSDASAALWLADLEGISPSN